LGGGAETRERVEPFGLGDGPGVAYGFSHLICQ
jgi:hypothetical protein